MKFWKICRIVSLHSWSYERRCCRTFKIHVVQKSEIGDYIRLKKIDVLYLEQKFVIFLLLNDNFKSASLAFQQPRSSFGTRTLEANETFGMEKDADVIRSGILNRPAANRRNQQIPW